MVIFDGAEGSGIAAPEERLVPMGMRPDGDTWQVSILGDMTDVTSKTLHEKTGQLLNRARQGERFRILRQ